MGKFWPVLLLILVIILGAWWVFSNMQLNVGVTPTPSATGTVSPTATPTPDMVGIVVTAPQPEETVSFPLAVKGRVTGENAWTAFEGQVGTAELYNAYNEKIGSGVPLTATAEDWMQFPTEFATTLGDKDTLKKVKTETGYLLFHNENASGEPSRDREYRLPVKFDLSGVAKQKITLFYYNQKSDPTTQCLESAILPVEREIPVTDTPVRDSINLLLQGKITTAEKSSGFTTEFPLEGFTLKSAVLRSGGVLTLEFNDSLNKTVGGSCRVSLLRWQVEKTAKQFPTVKTVKMIPESIFQP